MGIMNSVKGGADLTKPKMSIGWIGSAVIAVTLLLMVIGVGSWVYGKVKSVSTGVTSKVSGLESQASQQLEGFL